jgi:urease accessory protein
MSYRRRSVDPVTARRARLLLQVWLSPSFPVGAYAYSHGLEKAVELGWVFDRATLEAWLVDLCRFGSLRNDLILLAAAYGHDINQSLQEVAQLSAALQPSAERHLEATQQGSSFMQQVDAAWPFPGPTLAERFDGAAPSLPVVLAVAAHGHGAALEDTLTAYAVAFASNLVSAAIRLGVVGQSDGQRVVSAASLVLTDAAERAARSTLVDLGGAAFRSDVASMQHETQYTRLFRS